MDLLWLTQWTLQSRTWSKHDWLVKNWGRLVTTSFNWCLIRFGNTGWFRKHRQRFRLNAVQWFINQNLHTTAILWQQVSLKQTGSELAASECTKTCLSWTVKNITERCYLCVSLYPHRRLSAGSGERYYVLTRGEFDVCGITSVRWVG